MRQSCLLYLLFTIVVAASGAEARKPERIVTANVIASERDPNVRIELPREAVYVGADRWNLYDVADCEVHVFVEADARKVVQRLYWTQFEAYLPEKPEARYNYSSDPVSDLRGMKFHVRARFGATDDAVRAGSDSEHVRRLIQSRGYTMPPGMMNVRLVYLPDQNLRKELMFIYAEDVASTGLKWSDLLPTGSAADRWPAIQKGLLDRAAEKIQVHQLGR